MIGDSDNSENMPILVKPTNLSFYLPKIILYLANLKKTFGLISVFVENFYISACLNQLNRALLQITVSSAIGGRKMSHVYHICTQTHTQVQTALVFKISQ